jgi:hypothetical protein
VTPAERLAAKLTPAVLAAVLEHLEAVTGQARSEIVLHHGPDGVARGVTTHLRVPVVRLPARDGS